MWIGILHHVVNEHEWALGESIVDGKCGHDVLTEEESAKPWLKKDFSSHKALQNIVLNKQLLNKFSYYTKLR